MKGMMVQDGLTMDDALKLMEEGQKTPNRPAPKLPPKLLGMSVSLSSSSPHNLLHFTHPLFSFCFVLFCFFAFSAVVSSSSSDTDKHDFNYDTSSENLEVRSCDNNKQ